MKENASSVFESVAEPPPPGRQLAAARERCGFTVADVARQIKLSPSQVEAIEADDSQHLPGTVFVRGFIRNYARLVKLDPAVLLAATRQSPAVALPAPDLPHAANVPFSTRRESQWHKYAISALLAFALLAVYEFYSDDAAEITAKSRPILLSQPEIVASEKGDFSTAPQVAAVSELAVDPARTTAAQSQTDVGSKSDLTGRPAGVEHKPAEHLLKLRFDRESWVEIRDRNGRRISSQLNPAGTELAVSGLPPLSLVVGNAAGVRLTHNDQLVDLAPHIKIDVARLTLE